MARGRQVPPEANEQGRALGIVLFGGLLVSIVINGSYTRYVRPGIGPLLLGAGAILVLVGLSHFLSRPGYRPDAPTASDSATGAPLVEHASASGHRHRTGRTTWLLLIPSDPAARSAAAAGRDIGEPLCPVASVGSAGAEPALPAVGRRRSCRDRYQRIRQPRRFRSGPLGLPETGHHHRVHRECCRCVAPRNRAIPMSTESNCDR